MPTSWTQNYYHIVFSTKQREPFINHSLEDRLFPFIAGILRDLKTTTIAVNGMPDHVHILARYPSNLSHADMVRHIKGRSSKWIHETFPDQHRFGWQEGYGGFTVSRSMADSVEQYIRDQKVHHQKMSFKDELRALLRLHGIEFTDDEVFQ